MPSIPSQSERRKPQQARAALRRANFLEVAAHLIGEAGYEAVTMKAIAEAAGASIGTLYDYFPDKQTLALVLLAQYTEELDAYWATVFEGASAPGKNAFADFLMEAVLGFVRNRPAYLMLLAAPVAYSRTTAARQPLRSTIAKALQSKNPRLASERALIAANVIVELVKAFLAMYKRGSAKDRQIAVEEFRKLMRLYLADVIE
jgi:AcrR family transcriptional regulator